MLVSHRKRFIYTKTMKTAGTSVEVYFEPYCVPEGTWSFSHQRSETVSDAGIVGYRGPDAGGKVWYNHMPAAAIRRGVGEQVWSTYFKFCVIRNPFDRLVSAFHFFERESARTGEPGPEERGAAFPPDPAAIVRRFRDWVRNGGTVPDRDTYVIDDRLCVDSVIRYEELSSGLENVSLKLEIPFDLSRLPRLKAGYRPGGLVLRDYYDAETTAFVAEQFHFDLVQFGYEAP